MPRFFQTSDLDLAAYLMLNGLKLVDTKVERDAGHEKPRATMRFSDEKMQARDLERLFQTSSEKRYRACIKYLLKEAHEAIRTQRV